MLLAVAVAVGLLARFSGATNAGTRWSAGHPPAAEQPDNRPVALPPVDAPDAGSPSCARLLGALPATLTATPRALPRLPLAAPAPPGTAAWAGERPDQPVVLRCGLPRPAELTPTSALIVINGVSWLDLSTAERDTFIAVDRPVYLALTVSKALGTGPVQTISDAVAATLPAQPVRAG